MANLSFPCCFERPPFSYVKVSCSLYLRHLGFVSIVVINFMWFRQSSFFMGLSLLLCKMKGWEKWCLNPFLAFTLQADATLLSWYQILLPQVGYGDRLTNHPGPQGPAQGLLPRQFLCPFIVTFHFMRSLCLILWKLKPSLTQILVCLLIVRQKERKGS